MSESAIGQKERIQILLTEYASLRSEINARMTSVYQVAAVTAVAVTWLLQQTDSSTLYRGLWVAVV